jgi:hypothetical protein
VLRRDRHEDAMIGVLVTFRVQGDDLSAVSCQIQSSALARMERVTDGGNLAVDLITVDAKTAGRLAPLAQLLSRTDLGGGLVVSIDALPPPVR